MRAACVLLLFLACRAAGAGGLELEWRRVDHEMRLHSSADTTVVSFAEFSLRYPRFSGEVVADSLNVFIESFLLETVPVEGTPSSLQDAWLDLARVTLEQDVEWPPARFAYAAEVDTLMCSEHIVTLDLQAHAFTGGAHGSGTIRLLSVARDTGRPLRLDQLVPPAHQPRLLQLAESWFRRQRQLPDSQSLEAAGYWFPETGFYLPDNCALGPDSLLFQYGEYEIGPYAIGRPRLAIPLSGLEGLLTPLGGR